MPTCAICGRPRCASRSNKHLLATFDRTFDGEGRHGAGLIGGALYNVANIGDLLDTIQRARVRALTRGGTPTECVEDWDTVSAYFSALGAAGFKPEEWESVSRGASVISGYTSLHGELVRTLLEGLLDEVGWSGVTSEDEDDTPLASSSYAYWWHDDARDAAKRLEAHIATILRKLTPDLMLHIPHASRLIPSEDRAAMLPSKRTLARELLRMTDAWTDKLVEDIAIPATHVAFPVSRLVVDPERFPNDAREPMAAKGMGAVYTSLSTGRPLRVADSDERDRLMRRYYEPHHRDLGQAIDAALVQHGRVLIVDVHSFSSVPLPHEPDQDPQRPELCIGFDEFHAPFLADDAIRIGREAGFASVAVNRPFSGSIVPAKHWQRTRAVKSVMIEVRRDLYMDETTGERRADFDKIAERVAKLVEGAHDAWAR